MIPLQIIYSFHDHGKRKGELRLSLFFLLAKVRRQKSQRIASDHFVSFRFLCDVKKFFFELQFTFREMFWLHYGIAWDIMEEHNFKMKGEKLWD